MEVKQVYQLVNEVNHHAAITTKEGVMEANQGDWIIKGVQNELYPCKDSIFQQTYQEVLPTPPEGAIR